MNIRSRFVRPLPLLLIVAAFAPAGCRAPSEHEPGTYIEYEGGYPTEANAPLAMFDEYDYQAATQFYVRCLLIYFTQAKESGIYREKWRNSRVWPHR